MTLKSRLSRLQQQAGVVSTTTTTPAATPLRERLGRLGRGRPHGNSVSTGYRPPAAALIRSLRGEAIADGVIHVRQRLPLTGTVGAIELAALRDRPRLPGETVENSRRDVYIDTETTGLSGGSGTLAFLVGMAVVEDAALVLDQFLLTKFAAEADLLRIFAGGLSDTDRLVSYNGKTYDLPLLLSRFRLQSLTAPFGGLPHLDLLHPVRRLFGRRWEDCRLLSVERMLLGLRRIDDLPGSAAPAAWFDYVRGGHAEALLRVVEHNRQDIVSLAVAHHALAQVVTRPTDFGADLHALARWLSETDQQAARRLLVEHLDELCDDGLRLLGRLRRRTGDWPGAVALWEELAARGCSDSLERLAKYHEHISKDLDAARRCCDMLPGDTSGQRHRRRRIEHKLATRAEPGISPQTPLLPIEN
jgi:uncharacterized protein YprB with RNaseH-like and TPR domain